MTVEQDALIIKKNFNNSFNLNEENPKDTIFSRLGDRLWRAPGDDLAVSQLSLLWRSTLSKKGCSTLMKSGMFIYI